MHIVIAIGILCTEVRWLEISVFILTFTLLLWALERDLRKRYVWRARLSSIHLRKKAIRKDSYLRTLRMYKLYVKHTQSAFSAHTTYHPRKKTLILGKNVTSRTAPFTIVHSLFHAVSLCKKNKVLGPNWLYKVANILKWCSLFCILTSCLVYVYFSTYERNISCFWITFLILYAFVVVRCLVENDICKKVLKAAATDKNIIMEEESVEEFAHFTSFIILTCALRYGALLPFFIAISVYLEK